MDASPSVVVVDDDTALAEVLVQYLGVVGFEAVGIDVTNAVQMAQAINTQHPRVVLLDINLGHLTGFDVAHQLRALGYGGIVVAVTGEHLHDRPGRGLLTDFDEYWPKPIDTDRVRAFLQFMHGRPDASA
jgi:DNA-binding response OmpR family regulator